MSFADSLVGYHPFEVNPNQSFTALLKNWLEMVETGHWEIDESGVAGGMKIWKKADTEEHREKYVIKRDFS